MTIKALLINQHFPDSVILTLSVYEPKSIIGLFATLSTPEGALDIQNYFAYGGKFDSAITMGFSICQWYPWAHMDDLTEIAVEMDKKIALIPPERYDEYKSAIATFDRYLKTVRQIVIDENEYEAARQCEEGFKKIKEAFVL